MKTKGKNGEASEFYYRDERGRKEDSWLHEGMLADKEADTFCKILTAQRLVREYGWDIEETAKFYGLTYRQITTQVA